MKFSNKVCLGSLAALLFTQSTLANDVDVQAELTIRLNQSLTHIAQPEIAAEVNAQLNKAELEVRTQQLVARANRTVQTAPVIVELGE